MSDENEEQRKKRRRTKTKTFDFDEIDNEEQKMIQQAVRNSQMQTSRLKVVLHLNTHYLWKLKI